LTILYYGFILQETGYLNQKWFGDVACLPLPLGILVNLLVKGFDTFEGFSTNDIKKDLEIGSSDKIMDQKYNFSDTNEKLVLDRMEYPENCIVKKGYFPETTKGLEDKFAFVSLDADLYQPMLEGLKYFYPRLEKGGYIFVHDYFSEDFSGVKKAVMEYQNIEKIH